MTSRFAPFRFAEGLSEGARASIDESLVIRDAAGGRDDTELLLLLRLFSGSAALSYGQAADKIKGRVNYFSPDLKGFGVRWSVLFPRLVGEEVTQQDLADYIISHRFVNKEFYREILYELSYFLLHRSRKSYTSAFIYLYRLLERVSYCFPLIYASLTTDFKKSYNQMKSFFGDGKDKDELGFFKTFIDTIFKSDEVLNTTIDFRFAVRGKSREECAKLFGEVKRIMPRNLDHLPCEEDLLISVKYAHVGRFIVVVRNAFFHNLSRKDNLVSERLGDSELLFRVVNDQCMHWVASVFLQIFSKGLENFQRLQLARS